MEPPRGGDGRPGALVSEHRYVIPLARPAVWRLISEVRHYQGWWSWLRSFEAAALRTGEVWRCTVQPPLPYAVRFRVHLDEVRAPELVSARIDGDVHGTAVLTLSDLHHRCAMTLRSDLSPDATALRLSARFAAPVARYGHQWIIDSGVRRFVSCAAAPHS